MQPNRLKTRSQRCREQGISREDLVGKTITGVAAHPGVSGRPVVVMLQFDDGSCLEFMTPASERALRALGQSGPQSSNDPRGPATAREAQLALTV